MSVLVITDPQDVAVRAAVTAAARTVGPDRVAWVSGEDLAGSAWRHTLTGSAVARTRVGSFGELGGGGETRVTWFRAGAPLSARRWADPRDQAYAVAEFNALLVSWLADPASGAVNRVDGASPTGPGWSVARWRQAAVATGLEVAPQVGATSARLVPGLQVAPQHARSPYQPPACSGSGRSVLVIGDRVVGAGPEALHQGCRRLAAVAGCQVLEVVLDAAGRVETALPVPALDGPQQVAATVDFLVEAATS